MMKMLLNQAAVMIPSPEDAVDRMPHLKLLKDEIILNLKCSILNLKKSITCNRNKVLPSQVSFPCGSAGKESPCSAGDLGSIPGVGKIPWRREQLPTPAFWPGEFHGLYSPWGRKESDTTKGLPLSQVRWRRSLGL